MLSKRDYLFTEKYRPETVEECILPETVKRKFQKFIDDGEIPNLLLSGPRGTGKTSSAVALCKVIGLDHIYINASADANIDVLRTQISQFASTMSLTGTKKVVILDEVDGTYTNQKFQMALRPAMEQFADNCTFILTCNYPKKILPEVVSRCQVYNFSFTKDERSDVCKAFFKRCESILTQEGIEYNKKVLAEIIKTQYPDFRQVLNILQKHAGEGIDTFILSEKENDLSELVELLKERKFNAARTWISQTEVIYESFFTDLWEELTKHVTNTSLVELIHYVNQGQLDCYNSYDPNIALLNTLVNIMKYSEWKK